MFFFVLFCCFRRILLTNCPQTKNKKEQKDHAAGKIARCPLSFLLLDPPPPPSNGRYVGAGGGGTEANKGYMSAD